MRAHRKLYLIALVVLLPACSDSDITGVKTTKSTVTVQQKPTEDAGPAEVNKCAIYKNEMCDY